MFATIFKRLLLLTGALTMLASCSDDDSGLPYGYGGFYQFHFLFLA